MTRHTARAALAALSAAALATVGLTLAPAASAAPPPPVGPAGTWTSVFDDEFNGVNADGTGLDTTRWHAHDGNITNNVITRPTNAKVSGGQLILTLSDSNTGAEIASAPYAGAGVNGYAMPVGDYMEASVRFPGNGSALYNWPALWESGPNWPEAGEHDVAEVLEPTGDLTVNYHYGAAGTDGTSVNMGKGVPGYMGDQFHTFGVHRKATSADVYWDGVKVKSYVTHDNGQAGSLLLNIGRSDVGPLMLGSAGALRVDWVRAWHPASTTTTVPAAPVLKASSPASPKQVVLDWNDVPGATSYDIHEDVHTTPDHVVATVTVSNSTRVNLAGGQYRYYVVAKNSAGAGPRSNKMTCTVPGGPCTSSP